MILTRTQTQAILDLPKQKEPNVTITIKKTGAAEYGQYIKMFLYGPPGSGKTLFASTAKDVLLGNIDGGLMTLHERGIPYTDITSPEDAHELLMHLRQPNHGYKTVIIDTLDELQKVFIAARLKKERKEQMALQDWGYLGEQMQKVLRAYRNLPLNVIFLCHSTTETDNENGGLAEKPLLQGAIKDNVAGFFDLVAFVQATTTKEGDETVVKRHLRFQPGTRYPILKDRSGKMPPFYELNLETDFEDIHKLIYGGINSVPDADVLQVIEAQQEPEEEKIVLQRTSNSTVTAPKRPRKTTVTASVDELKGDAAVKGDPMVPAKSVKVVPAAEREEADALALLQSRLGAESTTPKLVCAECNADVDEDLADLAQIRYRKVLCQEHFTAAKNK